MKFSNTYGLCQPQNGYDFFDLDVKADTKKFVDPFQITQLQSAVARQMTHNIYGFMDYLLHLIHTNQKQQAYNLCMYFYETKGTGLGYSKRLKDGRGAGQQRAKQFVDKLFETKAVMSGELKYLEEIALVCIGINRDIISDITIALTRQQLVEFTQLQCCHFGIPMAQQSEALHYYDLNSKTWKSDHFNLPHVNGREIILIPESVVSSIPSYDYKRFYTNIAVNYFEKIAISEQLPCVSKLKNGEPKVVRKLMMEDSRFTKSKSNIANCIMKHPESLKHFRQGLILDSLRA